ncbi:hypothetical protein CPAR01_10046 [Colletotrichum paranaense]|uniref:Uncharacterized protein n=3 Tax=Colletotrichum acutatum species complex TaxID=2707335 RepID=A0AAI9YJL2_9PEZI|nr:uncharacterized protein CCOS01_14383 [Colletotrichum costaricense]XP_060346491.1 uncharacterized protein CPAR01_10046 [Colletotrichum paranaense]XP_060397075.1 uncharacterized protein CABS01_11856 [Colletotrichum abscissum]KAI3527451.1 hypothetical protein CSPX01_16963 [Colletotrichum filicis]KAK1458092.1 hypothetical protein CMEL01_15439 [Colletotrichum melonis]KAK1492339.1 hypothetical protein CABS01_11856 [Colletotrichum abscissum]KAK1513441.1 hypothetical protein CCOS01_14383 [Colletot
MIAAPLACRKCQEPSATSSTRLTSKGCIGVTLRGRFGRQANTASVASALSLALQTVGRGISGGPIKQASGLRQKDLIRRFACCLLAAGRDAMCSVNGAVRGSMLLRVTKRAGVSLGSLGLETSTTGGYVPSEATQRLGRNQ